MNCLARLSFVRVLLNGIVIVSVIGLAGCSSVTNVISGLTTPQSTISGSNYVYAVDPVSGYLTKKPNSKIAGEPIRSGDGFQVTLDFGFLRYIQAVDPYVIVFSECWMGSSARPADNEQTLRQVLLIKDGITPNARLPISHLPLLGPVTLEEDYGNVFVALKIVVLSKYDNAQSIQLLEGAAAVAQAAAPQYAVLSGAAADVAAAIVWQNKDKVEFEHSFSLTPLKEDPLDDGDSGPIELTPHHSAIPLRESRIAVLKGESGFRVVPYQTWYYYLWPFNWWGTSTDEVSRRFEATFSEYPPDRGWRSYKPTFTPTGIIEYPFDVIQIPVWYISRGPYLIFRNIFVLDSWGDKPYHFAFQPEELAVNGFHLTSPMESRAESEQKEKDEETWWGKIGKCLYGDNKGDQSQKDGPKYIPADQNVTAGSVIAGRIPDRLLYNDKTHMVFGISKTSGSLGNFKEISDGFTEHGKLVSDVTTSSSEWRKLSSDAIDQAFQSIERAAKFERARRENKEEAESGVVDTTKSFDHLDQEDREAAIKDYIEEQMYYTRRRFVNHALKNIAAAERIPQDQTTTRTAALKKIFPDIIEFIESDMNRWKIEDAPDNSKNLWLAGWTKVLDSTQRRVLAQGYSASELGFNADDWKKLYTPPQQTSDQNQSDQNQAGGSGEQMGNPNQEIEAPATPNVGRIGPRPIPQAEIDRSR